MQCSIFKIVSHSRSYTCGGDAGVCCDANNAKYLLTTTRADGYTGHVVTLPQDVVKFVHSLPRLPPTLDSIRRTMSNPIVTSVSIVISSLPTKDYISSTTNNIIFNTPYLIIIYLCDIIRRGICGKYIKHAISIPVHVFLCVCVCAKNLVEGFWNIFY